MSNKDNVLVQVFDNEKPINTVYAVLSRDKNGNEGIMSLQLPGLNQQVAAVSGDLALARHFKQIIDDGLNDVPSIDREIILAEYKRVK